VNLQAHAGGTSVPKRSEVQNAFDQRRGSVTGFLVGWGGGVVVWGGVFGGGGGCWWVGVGGGGGGGWGGFGGGGGGGVSTLNSTQPVVSKPRDRRIDTGPGEGKIKPGQSGSLPLGTKRSTGRHLLASPSATAREFSWKGGKTVGRENLKE